MLTRMIGRCERRAAVSAGGWKPYFRIFHLKMAPRHHPGHRTTITVTSTARDAIVLARPDQVTVRTDGSEGQ
jgi:hypothetical protein